jgi:3-oxocholest-4-en-26-oate---CoA ligase
VVTGAPTSASLEQLVSRAAPDSDLPLRLIACPLMHGTGSHTSFVAMMVGGGTVTLVDREFQPAELFATIERRRATALSIVGQAFAAPMLEHLDANPRRYDLSSLKQMSSSGVMWSQDNKEGLLRHMPHVVLLDAYGSSEAIGGGRAISTGGPQHTATFSPGPTCAVFTDDGRRVEPGSGERGLLAVSGYLPLGYYKDPAKSAATFPTIEGQRWSVPGDYAEVNADGTIRVLGRGSSCINTGGEKVFPEEVEEVLKTHPSVSDAVVVGVPSPRFGETICAVVEPAHGHHPELSELAAHVRSRLARYKVPRRLVVVESVGRTASGKVDHPRLKALAAETLERTDN